MPATETDRTVSSTASDDPDPTADEHGTVGPTAAATMRESRPPSRRDAILRLGIIVGVLVVVFGIILPRYIDYADVVATLQGLTWQDFLVIGIAGLVVWILTGAIFAALIEGLGIVRGTEAWLILTGMGASIPAGPWNMAVLWVVIRGWGRPMQQTTGGIVLYGIFDQLSRLGLMVVAGVFLIVAEASNRGVSVESGLIVAFFVVGLGLFVLLGGGLLLVVRSERLARSIGALAERIVRRILHLFRRTGTPDVQGSLVRFRVTLGDTVRDRGLLSFVAAMVSKIGWAILMIIAMRLVGVPAKALPDAIIFAGVAAVFVITILPISPGGAGVPELLYISFYTTYTGGAHSAEISAGVMLFRLFQYALPIPLAWILLAISRRGKPLLPTTSELRGAAAPPVIPGVSAAG